jgi:DNA repair exonuclease SbcCD ATPase subunit
MKTRLLPLIAVFLLLSGLLSGCGENTDSLKATIAQQSQQIEKLKEALEKESAYGQIRQSAVNASFVYEWSWPLRWLPWWSEASLKFGREMREQGWAEDWRAWAELAVLYAGLAGILGAGVGAGIGALRWMRESEFLQEKLRELQHKIREQEAALRKGQEQLERLHHIEEEVEAALEERDKLAQEIEEAKRRLAAARQKVEDAEQRARDLPSEIEREKARVLEEYRSQLEREQRAVQEATAKIARAMDDL